MLTLERLARNVVDRWECGDLPGSVRALSAHLQELARVRTAYAASIAAAREAFADDDCEIDNEPVIAPGDPDDHGCFISAWLWISDPD